LAGFPKWEVGKRQSDTSRGTNQQNPPEYHGFSKKKASESTTPSDAHIPHMKNDLEK